MSPFVSSTGEPYQRHPLQRNSVFDVRDFGAKGDGVTNDWRAVDAALQAASIASSAGNTVSVYLPGPAVYLVDKPLVLNASHMLLSIEAGAILRWDWDKNLDFINRWPKINSRFATMITTASKQQFSSTSTRYQVSLVR